MLGPVARRPGKGDAAGKAPGPLRLDAENEQLWLGSVLVPLRPKPFALLRYLVEHSERLVKKEELLAELWGDAVVGEGVLKTALAEIRRALGDQSEAPRYIETVHRRGYRFIGPLETVPSREPLLAAPGGGCACSPPSNACWTWQGRSW